jgi:hypothetical protein
MLIGFGDVDEHAGQKLERVEGGLIVDRLSSFGLVEDELGLWMIAKPGEVQVRRRAHQIAGKLVESLGVAGIEERLRGGGYAV